MFTSAKHQWMASRILWRQLVRDCLGHLSGGQKAHLLWVASFPLFETWTVEVEKGGA